MKHAVVERVGDRYWVTVVPSYDLAMKQAVSLATQDSAIDERTVHQHLQRHKVYKSGYYNVAVTAVMEI